MKANRESRVTTGTPKTSKRNADGPAVIEGYAAVYFDPADPGTEYRLYSDMVERIRPGAFDRAIKECDVRALFNHDANQVLGRLAAGTLRLVSDLKGLRYEIDPADTQAGRDTVTSLERGDVSGSSFTFQPAKTSWEEVRDDAGRVTYIRWLEEVELYDVGPVTFPAYTSADSGVRSAGEGEATVRADLATWQARGKASADQDYANAIAKSLDIL